MSNINKRTNSSNEIQQVPVFHKDIKKYCKQLTPQHLVSRNVILFTVENGLN